MLRNIQLPFILSSASGTFDKAATDGLGESCLKFGVFSARAELPPLLPLLMLEGVPGAEGLWGSHSITNPIR